MVKNLAKFQRRMRAIPLSVRLEVARQLEKEADKIVKLMKAFAPKDTGALAESIGWTWGDAPKGAITVGKVAGNEYDRIAITIYAGGTEGTARRQARSSGSRRRDQRRGGYFDSDNARFQEFGTVNMAANPFFFPVWRAE
ncbi:HK97 gp10 family phage protein, partial [Roseivivax isoporae]